MSINHSAISLLEQTKIVVGQLSNEQFSQSLEILSGSSIGQHVRHSLEFFICLQDALDTKVVNYDERRHDQYLERDVSLARSVATGLQENLNHHLEDFSMVMRASYDIENPTELGIPTSYHRELAYNIEHAIHHLALIKIGLRNAFEHVRIPDHFGVASSTVRYQKSKNA